MIKSAMVAMVVIGCDCDANMCEFIRETPAQWASVAECEQDLQHQTVKAPGFDYPLVTGLCRTVPEAGEIADATPAPAQTFAPEVQSVAASADDSPALQAILVDGSRSVFRRTATGYTVVRDRLAGTAAAARQNGGRLIDRLSRSF